MAKRVSPTAIGMFVIASLGILVAAVIVVGSGKFFRKPIRFVCMFRGDLNGLKVGAPVKVRGVQIGSVASIRLRLSPSEGQLRQGVEELRMPVIIDIDRSQITALGGTGEAVGQTGFNDLVKRGLRAQLQTESLLTGLLYIDLDLHPKTPLDLTLEPGSGPFREIPTVPTQLEAVQAQANQALAKLETIDFQALVVSITTAANAINGIASSPALKATLASLQETTTNLNKTVISVRAAIDKLNTKIDPLVISLHQNSDEVNSTLRQTRAAMVDLQSTLDPDSPLAVRLNNALEQLTETSRSIGVLADYLQQNPSALIRGRYVPDKTK
jgi:phospholipid/cholesterol/gamma-HCH transport system substrate-binding protein